MDYEMMRVGIYDADKNLIGYKADSFWILDKTCAKPLIWRGKIPETMITNLQRIIDKDVFNDDNHRTAWLNTLLLFAKANLPDSVCYIGVDPFSNYDPHRIMFTHKIENRVVTEIGE